MRRRLVLLAVAASLLLAAWWAIEWVARVDRYRPLVERELGRLTGLPVSIGRLDLRLFPVLHVAALRVRVGEADFRADAHRVGLIPDLPALLRGGLVLREVRVVGLSLGLPEDEERISAAWQELQGRIGAGDPASSAEAPLAVAIDRVDVRDVTVLRGRAKQELAAGTLLVEGLADTPVVDFALRLAPWDLSCEGALTLEPGESTQRVVLQLEGELEAGSADWPEGPFTGRLVVEAGPPRQLSFELEARDLTTRGTLAETGPGAALRIDALTAAGRALERLVAGLEETPLRLDPSAAVLKARDWRLELPRDGEPRLRSGHIEIEGVAASWLGRGLETPWSLVGRVEDGALLVEALDSGPVALRGALRPDPDWSRWLVTATGRAELGAALLAPFGGEPSSLSDPRGGLVLDELRAVLPADPDAPLRLRAHLEKGAVQLEGAGLEDSLSAIELSLEAAGDGFQLAGRARSALLGELVFSAARTGDATPVRGVLSLDAGAAVPRLPEASLPIDLAALLRAYGPTELHFEAALAGEAGGALSLRIARQRTPTLEGRFEIPDEAEGPWLGDFAVEAEIPAASLEGALPEAAELRGHGRLQLRRLGEDRFRASLDCAPLAIRLTDWIDKREGEPLSVALEGEARADAPWQARTLTLASGGDPLRFVASGDRWVASDASLDLAQWASLFPASFELGGRLAGSVSAPPLAADLRLDEAAVSLSPELPRLTLDGPLVLDGERWSTDGLRVRGPETDVVLAATSSGESLSGSLRGETLGFEALRSWVDYFQRGSEAESGDGGSFGADIDVSLGALRAGRSEMRNLRTRLRLADSAGSLSGLELDTYEGKVRGEASLAEDGQLRLSLDIREVTGRFLDDLFFPEEPRAIRGRFVGVLDFEGAAGDGLRPLLASGTGSLSWSARQGSFGRLGLATKLITVLRTAEVLRLRLPSIRDEGLVFDSVESTLRMQDGRLEIDAFRLDAPVYSMTATGSVDFAEDSSSIPIEFDALRGVSAILEPIPVAGDALKIAHVRLHASGSPYEMKIRVASFRDQVVGATMAVPNATVSRIRDALDLLKARPRAPETGDAPPGGEDPVDGP